MGHDVSAERAEPDFDAMLQAGDITPYFHKQLVGAVWHSLDATHKPMYLEDAFEMSKLGINTKDDTAYYYMAFHYAPDWLEELLKKHINEPMRRKIAAHMYVNRDKFPVGPSQIDLYDSATLAAAELGIPVERDILRGIEARRVLNSPIQHRKLAYPQGWTGVPVESVYDIRRWMKAMRDIYAKASKTGDFGEALKDTTQNWGKMEQIDFGHWLRFYQEGAHNKYKIARHISSNEGGYYVPHPGNLVSDLPLPLRQDQEFAIDGPKSLDINDARLNVEKQRSRIISRLNSAEKLLSSLDGQLFAGEDQEFMLKLLQDLKRKVQTANKIRVRSSLFEDFIYRTANFLQESGKPKAARFFYKIAQEPSSGDPTAALLSDNVPPPPPSPSGPEGGPDMPVPGETPPEAMKDLAPDPNSDAKAATQAALKEFFQLLETGVADITELSDTASADDNDADIVVYAQAPAPDIEAELPAEPPGPPPGPPQESPAQGMPIENTFKQPATELDDVIENALKNITVNDVVRRLELLSGLFKKREIARQLAIVDMMLDRLGIGTFFPSLGEATRSALESNQYVATRIEDVLSKLRGSMESPKSEQFINEELTTPTAPAPGVEGVHQGLAQQQREDEDRKERRKEREEQRMKQPTVEEAAPQELNAPTKVEQARPIQIR